MGDSDSDSDSRFWEHRIGSKSSTIDLETQKTPKRTLDAKARAVNGVPGWRQEVWGRDQASERSGVQGSVTMVSNVRPPVVSMEYIIV